MSTTEIHYGGQKYRLNPEDAEEFILEAQLTIAKIDDGIKVLTARLATGQYLWVVLSRSIPFAVVQPGELKPEKSTQSGRITVS